MNNANSVLQFEGYKILDFCFSLNKTALEKEALTINVCFDHIYERRDDEHFSVILSCYINDKEKMPLQEMDDSMPFNLTTSIEGYFHLSPYNEKLIPNAVAILFPYLRSFISTVDGLF